MIWLLVFGLIAVGGLVMVAAYAVWLWHKVSDLFSELEMLGKRAEELADLLTGIKPALPTGGPPARHARS